MTRERRQEIIRNLTQGVEAARLYNRRHARIIPERMFWSNNGATSSSATTTSRDTFPPASSSAESAAPP